jgi:hypothetical protein
MQRFPSGCFAYRRLHRFRFLVSHPCPAGAGDRFDVGNDAADLVAKLRCAIPVRSHQYINEPK